MSKSIDWLPTTRDKVLKMAIAWGKALDKYSEKWGIDKTVAADFKLLVDDLEAKMKIIADSSTRTPDAIDDCEEATEVIELKMRDIKKHWFLEPKLKTKDFKILQLKPPDHVRTPGKKPTAMVQVIISDIKNLKLETDFNYIDGNHKDPENKEYYLHGVVVAKGGVYPTFPRQLPIIGLVTARKLILHFAPEDVGKRVFLAVQVANGKKFGPIGPISSQEIVSIEDQNVKDEAEGKPEEDRPVPNEIRIVEVHVKK
jgi:hypothetical protein